MITPTIVHNAHQPIKPQSKGRFYRLLRLSSENGLEVRRTRDLPRSTFHEPGEGRGEVVLSSPLSFGLFRRRWPREDLRGDRGDLLDCDMV